MPHEVHRFVIHIAFAYTSLCLSVDHIPQIAVFTVFSGKLKKLDMSKKWGVRGRGGAEKRKGDR